MNVLKEHLVTKIESLVKDKIDRMENPGMLYLDEPIGDIDRINVFPYASDNFPISWWSIDGRTLIKLKDKLDNNKFYAYKLVEGVRIKVKLK